MSRKFLNVSYADRTTRIKVVGFEDLSEIRRAIKEEYGPTMNEIGAYQIQLRDKDEKPISIWKDFLDLDESYFEENGSFVIIRTLPPPSLNISDLVPLTCIKDLLYFLN